MNRGNTGRLTGMLLELPKDEIMLLLNTTKNSPEESKKEKL